LSGLGGGHSTDGEGMNWMTRGGGDDETGGDRKEASTENYACVIGHSILAGTYLAEYRDSLK